MSTIIAPAVPVVHALALVDELLALDNIRFKLENPEDGSPPSAAQINAMVAPITVSSPLLITRIPQAVGT